MCLGDTQSSYFGGLKRWRKDTNSRSRALFFLLYFDQARLVSSFLPTRLQGVGVNDRFAITTMVFISPKGPTHLTKTVLKVIWGKTFVAFHLKDRFPNCVTLRVLLKVNVKHDRIELGFVLVIRKTHRSHGSGMYFGFEKPCVLAGQIRAVGSPAFASRCGAPKEWHKIGHQ